MHAEQGVSPRWSSRFSFLMASVGVAVGLGNLWRFPFQAGQNGGAAFVLVYLFCVALIAWPILAAEIAFGRSKRLSAVGSTAALGRDAGWGPFWGVIGLVGAIASFFVLTTYSNVAGQIMAFSLMAFMGEFANRAGDAPLLLYSGEIWPIFWFTLFLSITVTVVAQGIRGGIERLVTFLMPIFFLLLVGLSLYALTTGAASEAIGWLFKPRFDQLTPSVVLAALGQAFYSIAVGSAAMITYGAYLNRKENIAANAGVIAATDTMVAIIAGLMIFPVVFAFGLDPAAGMGLIFAALPAVFSDMPAGNLVGGAFFFLAFIAALTTSVSMVMIAAAILKEWLGWGQARTSLVLGVIAWVIGVSAIYVDGAAGMIDFLAGNVFLPVGAFLAAILGGWILPRALMRDELHQSSDGAFAVWRFLIRWLCPAAVGTILVFGLIDQAGY
ncbi:MAG: sodium-dependent transporter [Pseudomonadota bacterium]